MNFIDYFKNRFPYLLEEDFEAFFAITTTHTYKKGDKIIGIGERKKKMAFILSGVVRGYLINDKGQEVTTYFFMENNTVTAYEPLIQNEPTKYTFECLEKTEALVIDYEDLERIVSENPRIGKVKEVILMKILLFAIKRNERFISMSPEKRYLNFVENYSGLLQRVSQKYIASYLGITPVSFSRLKKRIYKQEN